MLAVEHQFLVIVNFEGRQLGTDFYQQFLIELDVFVGGMRNRRYVDCK